jgi:CRP/FNR family cyclic AMP-dependent transcriptional regulator
MKVVKSKKPIRSKLKSLYAKKIFWGTLRSKDRSAPEKNKILFLKKIPIFKSLSRSQLDEVAQIVYERYYSENEYLFEVNQPGAALFMIQSGSVSVEIPGDNDSYTELAVLQKNAFLGELALLDGSPRSASARAVEPVVVQALSRDDLNNLIQTEPEIASQIYRQLANIIGARLKQTNDLLDKESEAA